jgi:hypothetical protein
MLVCVIGSVFELWDYNGNDLVGNDVIALMFHGH